MGYFIPQAPYFDPINNVWIRPGVANWIMGSSLWRFVVVCQEMGAATARIPVKRNWDPQPLRLQW